MLTKMRQRGYERYLALNTRVTKMAMARTYGSHQRRERRTQEEVGDRRQAVIGWMARANTACFIRSWCYCQAREKRTATPHALLFVR